ncbi:MAG: carbon-nitrogen family hydrolase, partial [Firmicutes bacterium]|nr:carbon-nitrogen family hydrolase [Bacillota bacterium]
MKISLVQMDIVLGRPEENQNRVADHLDCTMAQESPDIVVLPEMWNTGYDLSRLEEIADRGKLPAWLAELAEKYRVTLVAGSIAEKRD